jgi:type I restriction enzyme M protein
VLFLWSVIEIYLWGGGKLLTVIDDSVLAGNDFADVRDFIRKEFVLRGVISLPGDAFQRSGARAKTSILYLTKRKEGETGQPDIFVYECRYVGLDDVVLRTPPSVANEARAKAIQEIKEVLAAFDKYMKGKKGRWLVPAKRINGRLDAKFLRPWRAADLEPKWKQVGAKSDTLANLVVPAGNPVVIQKDKQYSFLQVTYAGHAQLGETRLGKEISYKEIWTAQAGDIVISNIGAVYRAICVLPKWAEGLLISSEFTVLHIKDRHKLDASYLRAILRSSAVIAEWLSGACRTKRCPCYRLASRQRLETSIVKLRHVRRKSSSWKHRC